MLILVLFLAWRRAFLLAGSLVLPWLIPLVRGVQPDMTCKFKLRECAGSERDFIVACPNALAASTSSRVRVYW